MYNDHVITHNKLHLTVVQYCNKNGVKIYIFIYYTFIPVIGKYHSTKNEIFR